MLLMNNKSYQALEAIDEIGDILKIKFSQMPVPQFSENDEDFRER